uniref:VP2 n=1 Tax=Aedes pseudoscutellaris reovirus TaxID=341721 RepID=A0A679E2E5_APRV|nr:VP2 [Aedes pseudoscutellaris reovirus]
MATEPNEINLRMTQTRMKQIEDTTFKIRRKHDDMYTYLINDTEAIEMYPDTETPFRMKSSLNNTYIQVKCQVPKLITQPPLYNNDMYPLNHNNTNFLEDRPFNYLCNFDWFEFLSRTKDELGMHYNMIRDLISMSSQTRYSNIWSNISGIIMYLRQYERGFALRSILVRLLTYWNNFPFFDTWDGFKDVMPKTSTAWPLLFYAFMSVAFDYICENISEGDAIVCFQNHLENAQIGYQDTKLEKKNGYTLWLKYECHNLRVALTPRYDYTGTVYGNFLKDTTEYIITNEFQENEVKMKSLLNPSFYKILQQLRKEIKTVEDIIRLLTICYSARDDRTYYGTLMELAISKAIKPQVAGSIVPKPIPTSWLQKDPKIVISAKYPSTSFLSQMQEFYRRYYPALQREIDVHALSASFINFLSTASAGVGIELPEEIVNMVKDKRLLYLLKKGSGKRVLQEALLVEKYNDLDPIISDFVRLIKIVVRKQIERRQRGIAGIPNNVLKINQVTYEANKPFSKIARAPSHGKQSGNASDIHDLLFYTTQEDISHIEINGKRQMRGIVISSADVKGMDTHIQINAAMNQHFGAIEILDGIQYDVGPFRQTRAVIQDIQGNVYERNLNGGQQAIAFGLANFSQTTGINSKYFGQIPNQEGTFPSGLITTSNHHTQMLTLLIETAVIAFTNEFGKSIAIAHLMILGDDVSLMLHGNDKDVNFFMKYLVEKFSQLGLILERDESRNFGVFLQQHVINGRFNGFSNRIAIFTSEDYKTRKSVQESCTEYNALIDDVIFRTYNVRKLLQFQRIHQFVVLSKYIFRVQNYKYEKLKAKLATRLNVFEYDLKVHNNSHENVQNQNMLRFIGIQIPYTYFQCSGGGEIPPESFQRKDGSFTYEYSIYSPKGKWLRKFLYDVSCTSDDNKFRIDDEVMKLYNLDVCDFLIHYNMLNIQEEIRATIIDRELISKLAMNLESLENSNARMISRRASESLRSMGIRLPANGVYGYQINERLVKVLQNIQQSDYEVKMVGDALFTAIMERFDSHKVRIEKGDILHNFTLDFSDKSDRLVINKKMIALHNISISKNMAPYSDAWMLYTCLDHTYNASSELSTALAHSQGHFKSFQYDRDMFAESVKIASKHGIGSLPMELFFEASNIRDSAQLKWIEAIKYYIQFKDYLYPYSINPRRLFFIPEQVSSVSNLLNQDNIPADANKKALMFRRAYAYVLSHPFRISGAKAIFVDDRIS